MAIYDIFKPSNFKCIVGEEEQINFFIQECIIPGITISPINVPHYTQSDKRPGDSIVWNPLTLTIVLDEELTSFKYIFNYLTTLKNPETGELEIFDNIFDGLLILTTNKSNKQLTIKFRDCWFSDISDIQLSTTSTEEEPLTFTTTIYYTYYKLEE